MDISFCILKTPFPLESNDYTVFLTKSGYNYLDYTIRNDKVFSKIKGELKKLGYVEMDDLRFQQSTKNKKFLSKTELTSQLRSFGLKYSKKLEESLKFELEQIEKLINPENIKNIFEDILEEPENLYDEKLKDAISYSKNLKITRNNKNIIPAFGEKFDLSFYLIFDFLYSEETKDFLIELNGSFLTEKANSKKYRNVIRIITETFERFREENSFDDIGRLCFRSIRPKNEIIKDVSFLYEVVVDLLRFKKTDPANGKFEKKEHFFDIFDIRDKINGEERIVISIDFQDYENMLHLSNSIKYKNIEEGFKQIDSQEVEEATEELIESLSKRMVKKAELEDFTKAAEFKRDINTIKEKVEKFKQTNKTSVSIDDFHKYFNLK